MISACTRTYCMLLSAVSIHSMTSLGAITFSFVINPLNVPMTSSNKVISIGADRLLFMLPMLSTTSFNTDETLRLPNTFCTLGSSKNVLMGFKALPNAFAISPADLRAKRNMILTTPFTAEPSVGIHPISVRTSAIQAQLSSGSSCILLQFATKSRQSNTWSTMGISPNKALAAICPADMSSLKSPCNASQIHSRLADAASEIC